MRIINKIVKNEAIKDKRQDNCADILLINNISKHAPAKVYNVPKIICSVDSPSLAKWGFKTEKLKLSVHEKTTLKRIKFKNSWRRELEINCLNMIGHFFNYVLYFNPGFDFGNFGHIRAGRRMSGN